MDIYYVTFSLFPTKAAHSLHIMKICQALADNGHNVTIVAPDYSNKPGELKKIEPGINDLYGFYNVKENFSIVKLLLINFKGWRKVFPFTAAKYVAKKQNALVFTRHNEIAAATTLYGVPTIMEYHHVDVPESFFNRFLYNKMLKSKYLLHIVAISEALKKALQETGITKQIVVAHDGSDLPANTRVEKLDHKDQYDLEAGYVGHLYPGKGMEVILSIAGQLPKVRFNIVGGNPADISEWQTKVEEQGIKNIVFHGFVTQSHISGFIYAFDVCLLPNQRKVSIWGNSSVNISDFTSPLKMFDYMAHGKVIIASDLPVLREVLDTDCAILCDPDKPGTWIDALNYLAANKQECDKLGANGLKKFKEGYTWRKRAEKIIDSVSI